MAATANNRLELKDGVETAISDADAALGKLVHEVLEWDPDVKTHNELVGLINAAHDSIQSGVKPEESDEFQELSARMKTRIAFGTAGLRARMTAGYKYMNQLTVLQASQGLCAYLFEKLGAKETQERGVVLGYDGRYNSRDYASLTAAVFISKGVNVHLYKDITCTPMVPYGVLQLKAAAGVMVTASHNPKDDNGYKVYWGNGAQIIPPHDKGIASSILSNLRPWPHPARYEFPKADNALLHDPTADLAPRYIKESKERYCWAAAANAESKTAVTYTAMHGVGAPFVKNAFAAFDLPPYIPVVQQVEPDPEFSTVAFPNPEEGKGALKLAIETAEKNNSRLILANDPDADRLAVAERDPKTGDWIIFNGNQIAALLADWVWKHHKKIADVSTDKYCMLASTVSSKFLKAMADKEGFTFVDTLTGFKWMGNVASDMEKKGYALLLAYEVEIGFLMGSLSLDKDGVRTAASFAEMANQVYTSGTTLNAHLDSLYKKYGYYEMNTSYFFAYTFDLLDTVFGRLRTGGKDGKYIMECGPHKVVNIRDVTTGYDSSMPDKKTILPTMPDAHMITFHFDNGCVATLRNSGTEPKLKYYVEANADTLEKARKKVDEMTEWLIKEFIRPGDVGLIAKKSS